MMAKKRKVSFSTKIILLLSAVFILMDVGLGAFLVIRSINKMNAFMQSKMIESACTAANLVNGDEIATLVETDTYENNEAYRKNYDILDAFKTSAQDNNAGLAYIYCLVRKGDDIVFSLDPSDDPAVFMQEPTIVTEALLGAFDGVAGFDTVSYVDRWGDLYSAYAPIFGSDGKVKAVIGADVWANWYKGEIASNSIAIGVITLSTVTICIAVSILVTRNLRKKYDKLYVEVDALQSGVKELIENVNDPEFMEKIKRKDKKANNDDQLLQLEGRISVTTSELKEYIEYARKQAYYDILSGLNNRNAYVKKVIETKKAIENKEKLSFGIVIISINDIKQINDNEGHEMGDKVIDITGHSIGEVFNKETSYRISGDEFVMVTNDNREESFKLKLSMFEDILSKKVREEKLKFNVTVSTGYASYNSAKMPDKLYQDVFREAEQMMKQAKEAIA